MTRFTGWHMTAVVVAFFAVVVAVNLVMATLAISTFGGTVVDDSYVAGQNFNRWLAEAKEQEALGWRAEISRSPTGQVRVEAHLPQGVPADATLSGTAVHPLRGTPKQRLTFRYDHGVFIATHPLPMGRWLVRVTITDSEGERANFIREVGT